MLAGASRPSVRVGRQSFGVIAEKASFFFRTGFVWRCPAIVNHSPAPGLSFSSCPRSRSARRVSPGHWGPSPTPPGFRGTRPGAGAPLPHRLRLPLKPLRSGHRFLGSPSQGQAGWPTGGAPAPGSEAPGEGVGPAGLQDCLARLQDGPRLPRPPGPGREGPWQGGAS